MVRLFVVIFLPFSGIDTALEHNKEAAARKSREARERDYKARKEKKEAAKKENSKKQHTYSRHESSVPSLRKENEHHRRAPTESSAAGHSSGSGSLNPDSPRSCKSEMIHVHSHLRESHTDIDRTKSSSGLKNESKSPTPKDDKHHMPSYRKANEGGHHSRLSRSPSPLASGIS